MGLLSLHLVKGKALSAERWWGVREAMQFRFHTCVSDGASRFIICLPATGLGSGAISFQRARSRSVACLRSMLEVEIPDGEQDNKVVACFPSQSGTGQECRRACSFLVLSS